MKQIRSKIMLLILISIIFIPLTLFTQEIDGDDDSDGGGSQKVTSTNRKGVYPLHTAELDFHYLGFLQFGPILSFRLRVIDGLLLDVHYRHAAMGLVYIALMSDGFTEEVDSNDGAVGGGFKYLFLRKYNPSCWYIGAIYEEGWGKSTYSASEYDSDNYTFTNKQRVYAVNFGYRWRFKSGMFMNLGVYAGQAETYDNKTEYDDGKTEEGSGETAPFSFIELSLGVSF